jgi:hypothetical protein
MTTLSICIPSHASLEASKPSVESALTLLNHHDVEIIVSDNSGDVDKATYFGSINRAGFRYCKSSYKDPMRNWQNAMENSRGRYVLMLGDDDLVIALPRLRIPTGHDDAIGFRPAHAMYALGQGVSRPTFFDISESRPINRIKNFLVNNGGSAVTLYSAIRRDWWRDMFEEYLANHPTRAMFTDWPMTYSLVSAGKLPAEGNLLYLYNSANWGTAELISKNTRKQIEDIGLPSDALEIQNAFLAVDSFVAVCRKSLALSTDEKLEAGFYLSTLYFNQLVDGLRIKFKSGETPQTKYLQSAKIAMSATSPIEQFCACLIIIELWLPHLRERYQAFMRAVLDCAVAKKIGI